MPSSVALTKSEYNSSGTAKSSSAGASLVELFKEIIKHKYYFNKFLLERYLNNFNYKKHKVIKNINSMKKQTKHIFNINNKFYTEKEIIRKVFDK